MVSLSIQTIEANRDVEQTRAKRMSKTRAVLILCYLARNDKENCTLLRGVEWVHGLFLFPLVLGKM